jgi:molybdopterin-guanine dinucleotide biosynthesis protein B
MKAFSVTGLTGSGKTTVIENIIKELVARGYTVGSVKEIHFDAFTLDTEGKNTYRHRQAGADTVTARSHNETDILYNGHLPIYDVLWHYDQDFVVLEGVRDAVVPDIAAAVEDAEPDVSPLTIAVSGRYANTHGGEYKGLPIINGVTDTKKLVDLIIQKTPPLMPEIDPDCCSKCGCDCRAFLAKCLRGEAKLDDCVLKQSTVSLKIDGESIVMVPFVQNILKNQVLGVVKELKGYKKGCKISVEFTDNEKQ